jgi:hypothetical protein
MLEIAGGILIAIFVLAALTSEELQSAIGSLILLLIATVIIFFAVANYESTLILVFVISPFLFLLNKKIKIQRQKLETYRTTSIETNLYNLRSNIGRLLLSGTSGKHGNRTREIKLSENITIYAFYDAAFDEYRLWGKFESTGHKFQYQAPSFQQIYTKQWFPEDLTIDELLNLDIELNDFAKNGLDQVLVDSENSEHTENTFFEDAKILLKSPNVIMYQHLIPQKGIEVDEAVMCNEKILLEVIPDFEKKMMKLYKQGKSVGRIHIKKWNELRNKNKIDLFFKLANGS